MEADYYKSAINLRSLLMCLRFPWDFEHLAYAYNKCRVNNDSFIVNILPCGAY